MGCAERKRGYFKLPTKGGGGYESLLEQTSDSEGKIIK